MAAPLDEEIYEEEEEEEDFEYYSLLNVDRNATQEEVRSAYRRLCRIYHPDRFAVAAQECTTWIGGAWLKSRHSHDSDLYHTD